MVTTHSAKLRDLASWYRERAEHTSNRWTRAARLRTAEDLEAEADRIDRKQVSEVAVEKISTDKLSLSLHAEYDYRLTR
jgi:hypothetical protein